MAIARGWILGVGSALALAHPLHERRPRTMSYVGRRVTRKRSAASPEAKFLLLVVAAAILTAYWAAHSIGMNLSVIQTVASVVGLDETVGTTHQVGYAQARIDAEAQPTAASPSAPYCQAGEQPHFANGMAALHDQVGDAMGTPLECEHGDGPLGNTVQQTSTGLAAYDRARNTETFTDGWRHWALTPNGLVTWEGTTAEPVQTTAQPVQTSNAADLADNAADIAGAENADNVDNATNVDDVSSAENTTMVGSADNADSVGDAENADADAAENVDRVGNTDSVETTQDTDQP